MCVRKEFYEVAYKTLNKQDVNLIKTIAKNILILNIIKVLKVAIKNGKKNNSIIVNKKSCINNTQLLKNSNEKKLAIKTILQNAAIVKKKGVCCTDQSVNQIEISNGQAVFVNKSIKPRKRIKINKKLRNIVLVLESPHKDEYNNKKKALGPAIGQTGTNIDSLLTQNLNPHIKTLNNGPYNFILMNSVQYQCSLGMKLGKNNKQNKVIKNTIFENCLQNKKFKKNFIKRLKKFNPIIIINCCTKYNCEKSKPSFQNQVQNLINQYNTKKRKRKHCQQPLLLQGYHPAYKIHFKKGFKQV